MTELCGEAMHGFCGGRWGVGVWKGLVIGLRDGVVR